MFLNEVMQETRKICTTENGSIWATPENLPFLKYEIYQLFPYSCGSKVPKWKCAHILLCKKYKNCLKLLNIADLQPPDWIQRKKNTLYIAYMSAAHHLTFFWVTCAPRNVPIPAEWLLQPWHWAGCKGDQATGASISTTIWGWDPR